MASKLNLAAVAADLTSLGFKVAGGDIAPIRTGWLERSAGAAKLRVRPKPWVGQPAMLCFDTVSELHKAKQQGGKIQVWAGSGGHMEFGYQ